MEELYPGRIRNSQITEFIYEYVPKLLNSIPEFVETFGTDFAEQQLRKYVTTVYINANKITYDCVGMYNIGENTIDIYFSKANEKTLTVDDLMKNSDLVETLVHECIHAILTKSKEECEQHNLQFGTGILQAFKTEGEDNVAEIARGINEGLTDWLCEKVGIKTHAYIEEKQFIYLLEKAVGTKKILELCKGDAIENFSKTFNIVSILNIVSGLTIFSKTNEPALIFVGYGCS